MGTKLTVALVQFCFFIAGFSFTDFCQAKGMRETKMEGELLKIITYLPLKTEMVLVLQILFLLPEAWGNVAK